MELHHIKKEKSFNDDPTLDQITDSIVGKYMIELTAVKKKKKNNRN